MLGRIMERLKENQDDSLTFEKEKENFKNDLEEFISKRSRTAQEP